MSLPTGSRELFFFSWPHRVVCGAPPAMEGWSLNHWTAREVPKSQESFDSVCKAFFFFLKEALKKIRQNINNLKIYIVIKKKKILPDCFPKSLKQFILPPAGHVSAGSHLHM